MNFLMLYPFLAFWCCGFKMKILLLELYAVDGWQAFSWKLQHLHRSEKISACTGHPCLLTVSLDLRACSISLSFMYKLFRKNFLLTNEHSLSQLKESFWCISLENFHWCWVGSPLNYLPLKRKQNSSPFQWLKSYETWTFIACSDWALVSSQRKAMSLYNKRATDLQKV